MQIAKSLFAAFLRLTLNDVTVAQQSAISPAAMSSRDHAQGNSPIHHNSSQSAKDTGNANTTEEPSSQQPSFITNFLIAIALIVELASPILAYLWLRRRREPRSAAKVALWMIFAPQLIIIWPAVVAVWLFAPCSDN